MDSLSITCADALMNSGTAWGDSASSRSASVSTFSCCSGSISANACDVSSITPGMFEPPAVNHILGYLQEAEALLRVNLRQRLGAGVEEALDLAPSRIHQRRRQCYERRLVFADEREYLRS